MYVNLTSEKLSEGRGVVAARFLSLCTTDMWGCPVHYKRFGTIPYHYPLVASNALPVLTTKNASRHCQISRPGVGRGTNTPSPS